ncbi:MAG: bifunctional phosphopantothenoylcysteine decarboxylase/phosphopantothenate--cysteine ligase CoaBC [bacterium]|nr:bifunctional phosphopantothenoylcysteine decarboxylase/phosphopantothenate--cysteine ligase CoaBC [bacterium]
MTLQGKTIVLGIGGGIAAYKSCDLVRRFREKGGEVFVVMTKAATQFITPLTLQTLSGHPVQSDLFNLDPEDKISHIALAEKADLLLVAPTTADLLAKISHGLCDDLLTTLICATKAPIFLSPSMNTQMWENSITQENVARLQKHGFFILEPATGDLACGTTGKGRLPEPDEIVQTVEKYFVSKKIRKIK